jgi:hypothetical protein
LLRKRQADLIGIQVTHEKGTLQVGIVCSLLAELEIELITQRHIDNPKSDDLMGQLIFVL